MSTNTKYNKEEQKAFIHGYLYAKAESMKEKGLFDGLEIKDVMKIITLEITK